LLVLHVSLCHREVGRDESDDDRQTETDLSRAPTESVRARRLLTQSASDAPMPRQNAMTRPTMTVDHLARFRVVGEIESADIHNAGNGSTSANLGSGPTAFT
jgi:hypothetical protein